MSRSKNHTKYSRPRKGITSDERQLEHQRRRAQLKQQLERDPDSEATWEHRWERGDTWNWD